MITVDNKIYRNLEEQVRQNQLDIKGLSFGLNIKGRVNNVPDLPNGEIGDAYLVGTEAPYFVYIKVSDPKEYINLGTLQSDVMGPKGDTGAQGEQGISIRSVVKDDYGNLSVILSNGEIEHVGNVQGVPGLQGLRGPKGDKGDRGEQGPQGETGDAGISFRIVGTLELINQLPDPEDMAFNNAYLVKEGAPSTTYNMYVTKGDVGSRMWVNIGPMHLDQDAINDLYMLTSDLDTNIRTRTTFNSKEIQMPDTSSKKAFYIAINTMFKNETYDSLVITGKPEIFTPLFALFGTPDGFDTQTIHAYVVIEKMSNLTANQVFRMTLCESSYGKSYSMTIHGYNGSYVGSGKWFANFKDYVENTSDIPDTVNIDPTGKDYTSVYLEEGRILLSTENADIDITDGDITIACAGTTTIGNRNITEQYNQIDTNKDEIENLKLENAKLNEFIHSNLEGEASQQFTEAKMTVPQFIDVEGYGYNRVQDNKKWTTDRVLGNTKTDDNLIDIENISVESEDKNYNVNFPYDITISMKKNDIVVPPSIWRMTITFKSGKIERLYDNTIADLGGYTYKGSAEDPIVKITTRGVRIESGSYSNIMVNKGDKPLPYQPHLGVPMQSSEFYQLVSTNKAGEPLKTWGKQKIVLRGVNDIHDEVYRREDNHAIKVDRTKEFILDGTQTCIMEGGYRIRIEVSNIKPSDPDNVGNLICAEYKTISGSQTYLKQTGISVSGSTAIQIYDPVYTSKEQWIARLKSNPITIVYQTKEEFETDLGQFTDADFELPIQVGGTIEQKSDTIVKATVEYGVPIILVNKDKEV